MKIPLRDSFATLCGFIGTLHDCLNVLAQGKLDINPVVSFTIPATGWGMDPSVPSHPHYLDFPVSGLSAADIVDVAIAPSSATVASAADFTVTQSYAGKFRLRCANVPSVEITAEYHVTNTAEYEI